MSAITPTYRRIFTEYERQRRLNLLLVIAPLFYIIETFFLVSSVGLLAMQAFQGQLSGAPGFALIETTVSSLVINIVYGLSWRAARRGQVEWSSRLNTFPTAISFTLSCLAQSARDGLSPLVLALLAGFVVVIALAGVLGGRGQLISIAIISICGSVATLMIYPILHNQAMTTVQFSALIFFVVADGAEFAIFLAVQQSSRVSISQLQELRIAVERAQQLDELKNQFISSVNHELRNPIMGMMGHLDNLVNAPANTPTERIKRNAERALQSAFALRRLVDSILDARRMDQHAGDFEPVPVNVLETLHAAVQLIAPAEGKMIERNLHIIMPTQLVIWGEPVRLQQILTNLLSNAIKYSPPGSPITVSGQVVPAPAAGKRGGTVKDAPLMAEVTVQDRGLGIPPDQAPLLFNKFVRLPRDLASTVVGNGLGLHLCKVLAEAMGGTIWVESTGIAGAGSTFHVLLPLAIAPDMEVIKLPVPVAERGLA